MKQKPNYCRGDTGTPPDQVGTDIKMEKTTHSDPRIADYVHFVLAEKYEKVLANSPTECGGPSFRGKWQQLGPVRLFLQASFPGPTPGRHSHRVVKGRLTGASVSVGEKKKGNWGGRKGA